MEAIIRYFIFHRTAVNLLMMLVLIAGAISYLNTNTQLWPTWETRNISVSITWPGASTDAVDRLVAKSLDQKINTLNRIDTFNTYVGAGSVYTSIDFEEHTDMDLALSEVQNKVASISAFPSDIENPIITLAQPLEHVTRILVFGDFSNRVAGQLSETFVDALKAEGIKNVRVQGLKHSQVYIDLDPTLSRQYGLTPTNVAERVRAAIRDGSGGLYEQDNSSFSTKVKRVGDLNSLGEITLEVGTQTLPLRELATISREYPESSYGSVFPQGNGFFLQILRNVDEDTIEVTSKIKSVIEALRSEISPNVSIQLYDTRANQISERLWLLLENALLGLILVAVTLFVFLNSRAAIWVVVGIPVAFAATFCLMWLTGQTVNMVSAFAMVMVLGIIVDDAIVVAENIAMEQTSGETPYDDAYHATILMWRPVLTATLTTIAAFAPILFLTDVFGSYVKAIPYFICAALVASLVECFILLPGHMRGGTKKQTQTFILRRKIDEAFDWLTQKPFQLLIKTVYDNRLIPILALLLFLGFAVVLSATNAVRFQFWLNPESNFLYANATVEAGADESIRNQVIDELWQALERAEEKSGHNAGELTRATFALEGYHFARGGNRTPDPGRVSVFLELADPDGKRIPASEFAEVWKQEVKQIAGLVSLEISPNRAGPSGSDIHLSVEGRDLDSVERALLQVEAELSRIDGVKQISNTLASEQLEAVLNLTAEGLEAGFKSETLSAQLFGGISGIKAHTLDDEGLSLDVRVRYARGDGFEELIDVIPISSPDGQTQTLHSIANLNYNYAKNRIVRKDGQISASILADVDREIVDASAVWKTIDETITPAVKADTGVTFAHQGKRKESAKAFDEITISFIVGIIAIYCILAWSMESMWWPFAVLAILPLGTAGALVGHYVLDYKMTMLSLVSLIALYGILVNDSIILFEEIRRKKANGTDWRTATITGYMVRLRPVLLTTITTIAGLAPLVLEQSYQAQFLIPIAITITWGLATATIGSFFLVPVMIKRTRREGP